VSVPEALADFIAAVHGALAGPAPQQRIGAALARLVARDDWLPLARHVPLLMAGARLRVLRLFLVEGERRAFVHKLPRLLILHVRDVIRRPLRPCRVVLERF
jgi:hypothetical protein